MRDYITLLLVLLICQVHSCKKNGKDVVYKRHYKDYHKTYIANGFEDDIDARVTVDRKMLTAKEIGVRVEGNVGNVGGGLSK